MISKLVQRNDAGEAEEATIAIQGIISGCLLPPFELKSNRPDEIRRLAHVRQSVTITGLGSTSFESIVENCRRTHTMFSRYTPNAKLHPLPDFLGKYKSANASGVNEHTTITASARFFTPAKQAAGFSIVDVNPELDPRGVLGKVDGTKWMHTDDNEVGYYMFMPHDEERYKATTPIIFQTGDIVELQASMLSIPSKGNYTVKLILRSIVLLDGHLTTDATTARTLAAEAAPPLPAPRRLKRRNPYDGYIRQQPLSQIDQASVEDEGELGPEVEIEGQYDCEMGEQQTDNF
ncbi:hypothetical protein EYR38_004896 [Pleurotus pulmonarius]|nr:hypothetical protein EYR38_004896 [Pleurotus pulmonarius]